MSELEVAFHGHQHWKSYIKMYECQVRRHQTVTSSTISGRTSYRNAQRERYSRKLAVKEATDNDANMLTYF